MAKKKTTGQLIKQLQPIFNKYIRLRDKDKPCISCGEYKTLQAGHFFAVSGYSGLRFDEDNVHGECSGCNCFDDSHLIHYGVNLEERIGISNHRCLHHKAQYYKRDGYKWRRSELLELIEIYKEKLKEF